MPAHRTYLNGNGRFVGRTNSPESLLQLRLDDATADSALMFRAQVLHFCNSGYGLRELIKALTSQPGNFDRRYIATHSFKLNALGQ